MSKLSALTLVAATTLPGCYFYYPSFPKTPKPQLVDGQEAGIYTGDHKYERECREYDRECHISRKGITATAEYTTVEIRYGERQLTQWEARQLVDPAFDKKVAHIKRNKGLCNLSLVPSVVAVVGLAALTIAGPLYDKLGDAALPIALGASGATFGGALLSYPMGGFACMRAGREYKALFGQVGPSETSFIWHDPQNAYIEEMQTLVSQFNANIANKAASRPDASSSDEDTSAGADAEATTPVTTPAAAHPPEPADDAPAAADRNFKVGDKVRVDWKGSPYDATILKVEGNGRYRIHYDGYASSWDESVPAERILSRRN